MFDDLGERPLQFCALQPDRRGFDCKCLRPKGFDLKSILLEFFGNSRENDHLGRLEFDQQGHQQVLTLHPFDLAIAQNFFKENALVGNMLVDYPQAVFSCGQDEGLTKLAHGPERAQMVQIRGGLFGFDLGGFKGSGGCIRLSQRSRPAARLQPPEVAGDGYLRLPPETRVDQARAAGSSA